MKTYPSKDAIYADYQVAFKFVLDHDVHPDCYKQLFDALATECRLKLTPFPNKVRNYRTEHPLSGGFFVDAPALGDTGKEHGTRLVLLEHETGLELFLIAGLTTVGSALALPAGKMAAEWAFAHIFKPLLRLAKEKFTDLMHGGVRIAYVEIRTEEKGVMGIPFADFEFSQAQCLLHRFHEIKHLSDTNEICFGGKLFEPKQRASHPLATDYY